METLNQPIQLPTPRKRSPIYAMIAGIVFIIIVTAAWIFWPSKLNAPTVSGSPESKPFSWAFNGITLPSGWHMSAIRYQSPAQQAAGEEQETVGFVIQKTSETGPDAVANWSIRSGGPQSAGQRCGDLPFTRCAYTPDELPMYTASTKAETLTLFENIMEQVERLPDVEPSKIFYTHTNWGFTVSYPPIFRSVEPSTEPQYIPPCETNQGSQSLICLRHPDTAYRGTNFSGAYAYIATDSCKQIQGNPRGLESINGTQFETYEIGDAGLGHAVNGKVWKYRLSPSVCLHIGYDIHTTAFGNYPEGSIKEFTPADYANVESALSKFVKSYQGTINP